MVAQVIFKILSAPMAGEPSVLACLEAALSGEHATREQGQLWLNRMISLDPGQRGAQSCNCHWRRFE